jgi:hypothetical protein
VNLIEMSPARIQVSTLIWASEKNGFQPGPVRTFSR